MDYIWKVWNRVIILQVILADKLVINCSSDNIDKIYPIQSLIEIGYPTTRT